MDSTKWSKQFQRLLQKANPTTYTLHRRHGQSLDIHFFIWFLNVLRALNFFIWIGARFQIFAPRLPIGCVQCCVECTFTLLRCIPLPKLKVFFFDKGKYFVHNCRSCSYFYFKNFYGQLLKVTLVNSYWFIFNKKIFKTGTVVIVYCT